MTVEDPAWHRDLADLDVPFSAYLDRHAARPAAVAVLLANCFALFGADAARYSALHVAHEVAMFGSCAEAFSGETDRIAGGTMRLATAMADELEGSIRLESPVSAVRVRTPSSVEVESSSGRVSARTVIVAVPLNTMGAIELVLPTDAARSVVAAGHVGTCSKVWTVADDISAPFWSFGWPLVPEAYGRRIDEGRQEIAAFDLVGEAGTGSAAARSVQALRHRAPTARFGDDLLFHDWSALPYSRGTWFTAAPGQTAGTYDLATQPGPCFFAGGDGPVLLRRGQCVAQVGRVDGRSPLLRRIHRPAGTVGPERSRGGLCVRLILITAEQRNDRTMGRR